MKKTLIIIAILIGVKTYSQEQIFSYYFDQPQPATVSDVNTFGEDIQGVYVKKDDEVVDIVIDSNRIEFRYITKMLLTTKEIKENEKYFFKNNLLFGVDSSQGLKYFIENDTVYFGIYQKELFFELNANTRIRKYGNQYILNEKKGDGIWEVRLLYKKGENLYLRSMDIAEEEEKANKILPKPEVKRLKGEKVYVSSPKKTELYKFIEAKGFFDILYYFVKKDE